MSSTHTVRVSELKAGDWVRFDALGEPTVGQVDEIWEEHGKIVFYVEVGGGACMTRTHAPDDEIEALDAPPDDP